MKKLLCIILAGALIFSAASAFALELYALAGRIVGFDYASDEVFFVDGAGLVWSFYGIEDWSIGDIVACVMSDNNTEEIDDDIILSVRYNGLI